MTDIRRITKDGVCDQVYKQLKDNVLKGTWQPGDKIPSENQLVSLFGVSRASIRMALQRMITLGLLESRVGNGSNVRQFTPGVYINELVPISSILLRKTSLRRVRFRAMRPTFIRL